MLLREICPSFLHLYSAPQPPNLKKSSVCVVKDEMMLAVVTRLYIYVCFIILNTFSFSFFFRAVLEPLLSLTPPAHSVFIVVDSLDSGYCGGNGAGEGSISGAAATQSSSIAELLLKYIQLLPPWILLVCSARRQNKAICKIFSGTLLDDAQITS